jgi:V8-like Glu-specific endopeptidase
VSRGRLWCAVWATVSACAASETDERHELDVSEQAIIYGEDNRLDVYAHPNATLRALTQSSVVALIPRNHFLRTTSGDSAIFTLPLKDAFEVCADERFANQPTAADCSGVLIDDDLVLTAGHCFHSDNSCDQYSFTFDYFFQAEGRLASMGWGDIYGCRKIVHRTVSALGVRPRIDYAVIQLDRPAVGRTPVTLRATPLVQGEPLATIGSVSGLPAKIDTGSQVLDTRVASGDYFLLDSDTFSGSSGSGVFDAQANLVGVLVRGGADYEKRADGLCQIPKVVSSPVDGSAAPLADAGLVLPPDGITVPPVGPAAPVPDDASVRSAAGEEATYVARAIEGLCTQGYPSARLCGGAARCGDGFCTQAESRATCPADCACGSAACGQVADVTAASVGPVIVKARPPRSADGCIASASPAGSSAALTGAWAAIVGLLWRSRRRRTLRGVT